MNYAEQEDIKRSIQEREEAKQRELLLKQFEAEAAQAKKRRDLVQAQTAEFLANKFEGMTHAVSLTFDQTWMQRYLSKVDEHRREALKREKVEASYRAFLRRLNEACLNTAHKKYGKTIAAVGVIEGLGYGQNAHYHCAMQKPKYMTDKQFAKTVYKCWKTVDFAGKQVKVETIYNAAGWGGYLSKTATDAANVNVDWNNIQ